MRKLINQTFETSRYAPDSVTSANNLKELKQIVDDLISRFGEDAGLAFDCYDEYGSNTISQSVYVNRPETDEEYRERIQQEHLKSHQEKMKREALYRQLQQEFDPHSTWTYGEK